MTQQPTRRTARITRLTALPLLALLWASAAQAQAPAGVQDFRLPPSTSTPAPSAAGPVDSDHPIATPTRAAPAAAPPATPTPTPIPSIALPPVASEQQPAPRTARPAPQAVPMPIATVAAPATIASPAPVTAPLVDEPVPAPTASAASAPAEPPASPTSAAWPWIAGGAALVALLGALFAWRRRAPSQPEVEYEPASLPSVEPQPSPPAALTPPRKLGQDSPPQPAPPPPPPAPSPLPPLGERRPIEMQLEARHLSRAMVNASLAYRLTLTNCTDAPVGPLRISGDITSAHASLSTQEQLDPGTPLAAIHEVSGLASGESVSLSGELRLPIASILPIQSGGARVFVPLARFRAESEGGLTAMRVFVIGQQSDEPQGSLRPFALDRGPGVDRGLGQRELEIPA